MTGRRTLLLLCLAAWLVRLPLVSSTVLQNADETWALHAASPEGASAFWNAPSMADRWTELEKTSAGGRILWILNFYLMAKLCSGPVAAYTLNLALSFLTLWLLAGTARRLHGERAELLCWILGSGSPFLLHYGFRVVGTMPSVMWVTLAIRCLCGPPWRLRTWVGAGACFGLAFATHYGTGAVILALATGLVLSLRGPTVHGPHGTRRRMIAAICGGAIALLPLITLELWSRHAGSSYVRRLFSHERLGEDVAGDLSGPHGLFLRHYLELDPLLVALALISAWSALRRPVAATLVVLAALAFVPIIRYPPAGSWAVGLLLTSLAILVLEAPSGSRSIDDPRPPLEATPGSGAAPHMIDCAGPVSVVPETETTPGPFSTETTPGPFSENALTWPGLLLALGVVLGLFTLFRPLSAMCRLSFTMWPLLLLAVSAALARSLPESGVLPALRRTARLALVFLALALFSLQRSKSFDHEAARFGEEHPTWRRLHYIHFVRRDLEDGLAILARDKPTRFVTFGPPRLVTPVTFFDDEPFKLLDLQQRLPAPLTVDEVVYAWIYYPPPADAQ